MCVCIFELLVNIGRTDNGISEKGSQSIDECLTDFNIIRNFEHNFNAKYTHSFSTHSIILKAKQSYKDCMCVCQISKALNAEGVVWTISEK